jgi:hypothetical protein
VAGSPDFSLQHGLNLLLIDSVDACDELRLIFSHSDAVASVQLVSALPSGIDALRADRIDTIFIDPLEFSLEEASSFIFRVRRLIPKIVFVIYSSRSSIESQRAKFYHGERSRLSHYFFLDKDIPKGWLSAEADVAIGRCLYAHRWIQILADIDTLRDSMLGASMLAEDVSQFGKLVNDARDQLMALLPYKGHPIKVVPVDNSVFVSYRFQEENYASTLKQLLLEAGFTPVTGERANGYIGRSVIERIRNSRYFLCLMTRLGEKFDGGFTCSPWLLEEKGVALAFDKRIVMLVEDGVTDYGLMQGDWERIHFDNNSFSLAAIRAISQLKSYRGDG